MLITRISIRRRIRPSVILLAVIVAAGSLGGCLVLPFGEPRYVMGVQRLADKYFLIAPVCERVESRVRFINVTRDDEDFEPLWELETEGKGGPRFKWPSMMRFEIGVPVDAMKVAISPKPTLGVGRLRGFITTRDTQWQFDDVVRSRLEDGEIMTGGEIVDVRWLYREGCNSDPPPGVE